MHPLDSVDGGNLVTPIQVIIEGTGGQDQLLSERVKRRALLAVGALAVSVFLLVALRAAATIAL